MRFCTDGFEGEGGGFEVCASGRVRGGFCSGDRVTFVGDVDGMGAKSKEGNIEKKKVRMKLS